LRRKLDAARWPLSADTLPLDSADDAFLLPLPPALPAASVASVDTSPFRIFRYAAFTFRLFV